ncbi:UNVERIFIED_CONTAM: La protein 1 [Sesamum radiatum]|uniref:La protein 1 n=1 Tax=Sesamum radiatum TaxID=300843 RepID=A0AAW2MGS3_SESRA
MASATSLDEETAKKVIRQVEFYFSDSNLPRDAFLKKTISESDDGSILLFYVYLLTHARKVGVPPACSSGQFGVDFLIFPDERSLGPRRRETRRCIRRHWKKVGRVTELAKPEEVIKQSDERTIAASPLEYDVKIEDVETFFGKYAKVNSVRLPRHVVDNRLFCGTALIEFSSEEDASNILKQTLSYSGVELELKPKKDFDTERAKQEEEAAKIRSQVVSSDGFDCGSYPKGLIVAFKLKSISAEDSTTQNGNHESVSDDADVSKKDGEQDKTQVNSEETGQDVTDMTTNHVENAGKDEEEEAAKTGAETEAQEPEDAEKSPDNQDDKEDQGSGEGKTNIASYMDNKDVVLREDLKSIFQKFGTVKFIDFKIGSDSGYVRFEDAGAAQKARAAAVLTEEGGLIVKNFIATLDPVTGEAEKEYWSLLRNNQEKYRDNYKSTVEGEEGTTEAVGILVASIIAPEKMTRQIAPAKSRKLEQHETVILLLDSTNQFCALYYYLLVDHRLVL